MVVHISQPRIYPHLSYLEKIASADLFVVMDDLIMKPELFERRNRYYNPMSGDARFLTIPTEKGKVFSEMKILDMDFAKKHRRILYDSYRKSPYFSFAILDYLVCDPDSDSFMEYFFKTIHRIFEVLDIITPIELASKVPGEAKKTARLNQILEFFNADEYLSGSAGANYINGECIIPVTFRSHEEEKQQFHTNPNTNDMLMFADTLFNCGIEKTKELLKYAR